MDYDSMGAKYVVPIRYRMSGGPEAEQVGLDPHGEASPPYLINGLSSKHIDQSV